MADLSSLFKDFTDFINREVSSSLDKLIDKKSSLLETTAHSNKFPLSLRNSVDRLSYVECCELSSNEYKILEDLRTFVGRPLEDIFSRMYSSYPSLFLFTLKEGCESIAEECVNRVAVNNTWPIRISNPDQELGVLPDSSDFVKATCESVSSQMDDLVRENARVCGKEGSEHLWGSFLIHDLERAVKQVRSDCYRLVDEKNAPLSSRVRLGRVYAWARERQHAGNNDSSVQELIHARTRLRRKLAQLVWLSRAAKRRARSHPLLVSLRHELMRIRTRATSRIFSERTAAMGFGSSCEMGKMTSSFDDSLDSSIQRIIPADLRASFRRLIEDLTDLLSDFPAHTPGISIITEFDKPEQRREHWQGLITRTVLSFYDNLDTWADVDSQLSDSEMGALSDDPNSCYNLDTDSSAGESEKNEPNITQATGRKFFVELNPALVQAALDRFDHRTRGQSRRTAQSSLQSVGDDRQAVYTASEFPHSLPAKEPVSTATSLGGDGSLALIHSDELRTGSPVSRKEGIPSVEKPEDKTENEEQTEAMETDVGAAGGVENDDLNITSGPKRKTNRSLRARLSRTPSEASYSEGEVLTDSDEDQDVSADELPDDVPELGEKTKPDKEKEQNEDLIKMVSSQLRDSSPVSDIDLTELEIMDEWAPPATSGNTENAGDLEQVNAGDSSSTEPNSKVADAAVVENEVMKNAIASIMKEALDRCQSRLAELVVQRETGACLDTAPPTSEDSAEQPAASVAPIKLSDETEASIERTASAFKEHVTSVLANLLHAVPLMLDKKIAPSDASGMQRIQNLARRPATGRRGSRLLGMLRAYQQDAVKRLNANPS